MRAPVAVNLQPFRSERKSLRLYSVRRRNSPVFWTAPKGADYQRPTAIRKLATVLARKVRKA